MSASVAMVLARAIAASNLSNPATQYATLAMGAIHIVSVEKIIFGQKWTTEHFSIDSQTLAVTSQADKIVTETLVVSVEKIFEQDAEVNVAPLTAEGYNPAENSAISGEMVGPCGDVLSADTTETEADGLFLLTKAAACQAMEGNATPPADITTTSDRTPVTKEQPGEPIRPEALDCVGEAEGKCNAIPPKPRYTKEELDDILKPNKFDWADDSDEEDEDVPAAPEMTKEQSDDEDSGEYPSSSSGPATSNESSDETLSWNSEPATPPRECNFLAAWAEASDEDDEEGLSFSSELAIPPQEDGSLPACAGESDEDDEDSPSSSSEPVTPQEGDCLSAWANKSVSEYTTADYMEAAADVMRNIVAMGPPSARQNRHEEGRDRREGSEMRGEILEYINSPEEEPEPEPLPSAFPDSPPSSPGNPSSSNNPTSSPGNPSSPDNAPSSPASFVASPTGGSLSPADISTSPDNASPSPDNPSSSPVDPVGSPTDASPSPADPAIQPPSADEGQVFAEPTEANPFPHLDRRWEPAILRCQEMKAQGLGPGKADAQAPWSAIHFFSSLGPFNPERPSTFDCWSFKVPELLSYGPSHTDYVHANDYDLAHPHLKDRVRNYEAYKAVESGYVDWENLPTFNVLLYRPGPSMYWPKGGRKPTGDPSNLRFWELQ